MKYYCIESILDDILGTHKKYRQELLFNCPHCDMDKDFDIRGEGYNLCVNLEWYSDKADATIPVWKCWVCDDSGSIQKLINKYGTTEHKEAFKMLSSDKFDTIPQPVTPQTIKLPKEFRSDFNASVIGLDALKYLRSRSIDGRNIRKWGIGYCEEGRYANRIIIPSFCNHPTEPDYFVARRIYDEGIAREQIRTPYYNMKYLNPPCSKSSIIFGEGYVDWSFPVILVEGVFDALSLYNSIALLGKKIPDVLIKKLMATNATVVVALDNDVKTDHKLRSYKKLIDYGIKVYEASSEHKDISILLQKKGVDAVVEMLSKVKLIDNEEIFDMFIRESIG